MKTLSFLLSGLFLVTSAPTLAQQADGPHLSAGDFAARRQRLIGRLEPGSVVVMHAAPVPALEVDDLYRQASDFWYVTGFPEPEAVAVLRPGAEPGHRYVLFVSPRDPVAEQWAGRRAGVDGARTRYGADEAYSTDDLWKRLPDLLSGARALHVGDGGDAAFRGQLEDVWRAGDANAQAPRPVANVGPLLAEMRLIKDEAELRLLRRAVDLSVDAHMTAMKAARPGAYEYQLKAAMVGTCLAGGAARMAFTPIVGSGPNSVILHYPEASRRMEAGDVIVSDNACEYEMYAADITRTYPVSGRFTDDQRRVYAIVLEAQKAGIAAARAGAEFRAVYDATVRVITTGLVELGLLSGDVDELIRTRAFTRFYPHGSSHWLGLGVHDVGSYDQPVGDEPRPDRYFAARRVLEPGMVLTVEPGIYVPEGSTPDKRWWNLGVRIEDDVLITADGPECLSCRAPREIADVEAALGR
jgi:Xaa-Pro aminopeptidase